MNLEQDLSFLSTKKSSSCTNLEKRGDSFPEVLTETQMSSSLPLSPTEDWNSKDSKFLLGDSYCISLDSKYKDSQKLVQNCGPDCMITQRIVDRLLSRMLQLENERSELLAANRSWAVQFQMMQEGHQKTVKSLEEDLRKIKEEKGRLKAKEDKNCDKASLINLAAESCDQLKLLSHQAEIYREDFIEERKARVRAHAQIETLKNELKRERKSRVKLAAYVQQTKVCEAAPEVHS